MNALARPADWLPWSIWLGGAVPGVVLLGRALAGELGANPVDAALNGSGELAIKCLILCLSMTPWRIVRGGVWPVIARKHLGLLAFAYAACHLVIYVALDRLGDVGSLARDVLEHPFVAVGLSAFAALVPLAVTSSKRALQRLGAKRWARLHRLAYVAAGLAVVHFVMRSKKDATEALLHGAVLGLGFVIRLFDWAKRRSPRALG